MLILCLIHVCLCFLSVFISVVAWSISSVTSCSGSVFLSVFLCAGLTFSVPAHFLFVCFMFFRLLVFVCLLGGGGGGGGGCTHIRVCSILLCFP